MALDPVALHCRDLVRRVHPDRALLAELAPSNRRPNLWAIAAFDWEVARIPDLVSEPMLGAIRRQWWRDAWAEIGEGRPRRHPVVEALAAAHATLPLPLDAVETYLQAREEEQKGPPSDTDAMHRRAAALGGSLARMEAARVGEEPERAASIGTGWALLAEVRALPRRLQNGRHGLPADRVASLSTSLDRVEPLRLPFDLAKLLAELCSPHLASLREQRPTAPLFRGYRSLALMYARRLQRTGWNPFDGRVHAHTFERAWRVARLRWGLYLN